MDIEQLPKAARSLVEYADWAGWRHAVADGVDTGGSPFVTVALRHPESGHAFRITWHTRNTGTYRLFSKSERPAGKGVWRDATSIKAIRAVIGDQRVTDSLTG